MNNINKIFILTLVILSITLPAFAETKWEWICSNNKYSQFFAPETLDQNITSKTITVWTKTTYSYEGAEKTIKSYNKDNLITDPSRLSYSMSRIIINPQERKILYLSEVFYDTNGKSLWAEQSNNDWDEITPYSYNEKIFYGILDYVYHRQDLNMVNDDKNRWIPIAYDEKDGKSSGLWIDKLSIIKYDNYATAWERHITRDSSNKVINKIEVKIRYNFFNNSTKFICISVWEINKGWVVSKNDVNEAPNTVIPDSQGEYEYNTIRDFIKNNSDFIDRYSKLQDAPYNKNSHSPQSLQISSIRDRSSSISKLIHTGDYFPIHS